VMSKEICVKRVKGDLGEESGGASAVHLSQAFLLRWRQEALCFGCNLP
jgi:hypothetical protein